MHKNESTICEKLDMRSGEHAAGIPAFPKYREKSKEQNQTGENKIK